MIVDLFAGPGGLDVGAHWLGVPTIGIEFDQSANETRAAARLSTISGDVRDWGPSDFSSVFNVLTGGPPCQTYTVAGNGHGRRSLGDVIRLVGLLQERRFCEVEAELSAHGEIRTGLVLQPLIWALRAIDSGKPYEAIMLEQVPAVKPVWDAMAIVLRAERYGVDVGVMRTEEYGVPQTRRRAVLIARRQIDDRMVELPKPTHQRYFTTHVDADLKLDSDSNLPRWISMGEVLDIPERFTVESNYGSGGDPKNRSKRQSDRPAFTVTGKASRNKIIINRDDSRRISPDEAARLQTFPSAFPWRGRDVSQQIGNAIPPRLAAHVLNKLLGLDNSLDARFFEERKDSWQGQTDSTVDAIIQGVLRRDALHCAQGESGRVVYEATGVGAPPA